MTTATVFQLAVLVSESMINGFCLMLHKNFKINCLRRLYLKINYFFNCNEFRVRFIDVSLDIWMFSPPNSFFNVDLIGEILS